MVIAGWLSLPTDTGFSVRMKSYWMAAYIICQKYWFQVYFYLFKHYAVQYPDPVLLQHRMLLKEGKSIFIFGL